MAAEEWDVCVIDEVLEWIGQLDDVTHTRVVQAIDALAEGGPGLGRPLVEWYRHAIPLAELRYEIYLKERQAEEGG